MTQAKTKAACSSVPLDPLVGPDADFEVWYERRGLSPWAHWHPERRGYTLASIKQLCWEVWQASMSTCIDAVDDACETFELSGMHGESGYKELKRLLARMVDVLPPNAEVTGRADAGREGPR